MRQCVTTSRLLEPVSRVTIIESFRVDTGYCMIEKITQACWIKISFQIGWEYQEEQKDLINWLELTGEGGSLIPTRSCV